MTDTSKVLRYLERAAARAEGRGDDAVDLPPESETIRYARERLTEAAAHAHAGTDIPSGARLRPVKQALISAVRPVTSNQVIFNEQALRALDGLTAAADRLASRLDRDLVLQEQRVNRLQAGVATTDLTVDDLDDDVRRLGEQVDGLAAALDGVRAELASVRSAELAALRGELAELTAKQHLVFATAHRALAGDGPAATDALAAEHAVERATLWNELDAALRGGRDAVKGELAAWVDEVVAAPGSGPVVDLGCGRGEFVELLRDAGVDAYGVDVDPAAAEQGAARGLDVRTGEAEQHLRDLPEGSVRAVTAFHLAHRLPLDHLASLLDAALVALAPDGVLLLEAPNPTNVTVGAAEAWLDPAAGRPLHPRLLELLVLARGFAEADVRYAPAAEGPVLELEDLVSADSDPVRAQALVDRVNWALAGPAAYAVVARRAPAPAPAG